MRALVKSSASPGFTLADVPTPTIRDDEVLIKVQRAGLFRQGLLVNLTNPKAIVFMAALTPSLIFLVGAFWLMHRVERR